MTWEWLPAAFKILSMFFGWIFEWDRAKKEEKKAALKMAREGWAEGDASKITAAFGRLR